ncbi:hypothetical protein [Winogradskyella bathintestinalis]|uniref:Lipid/polyisoprenoid-binding YceI-like domain-containing protein n=1 Tax=Winogradskyella bathintestinalis TaxID=3035208 RepID=A0ABT7ZY88_9FLAO|nr:hypothetical protein [Winogradskyella bathintestinalis]MDN3493962.1 hypothetical protein [Winogradskyella bathintestinalis]
MKNTFIVTLFCVLLIISCSNDNSKHPFTVANQQIGLLTDSTQVKELDAIFKNDSVVRYLSGDEFIGSVNTIEIFEKGGKKLLNLSPKKALDSTSVIKSVNIIDSRFKTEKNISILSTFKDIKAAYKISSVSNLINVIVISVDEINASFTIDKKELPASMRFDMDMAIDPIQIPEKAKIKYFMIHW